MSRQTDISFKGILNVALPLILMGLSHNVINAADTAFMGRLGEIPIGTRIFFMIWVY